MTTVRPRLHPRITGIILPLIVAATALCASLTAFPTLASNVFEENLARPRQSGTTPPANSRPIPSDADLAKSRVLLKELFGAQLADATPTGRRKLARALLDAVPKTADNPVDQYAMLVASLSAAKEGASLPLCIEAADTLGKIFGVDAVRTKGDLALAMDLKADSAAATDENVRAALKLVDDLADEDNFADASKLCASIQRLIPPRTDQAAQLAKLSDELRATGHLVVQLRDKPDDPVLNLAVGGYYCFVRDRWDKGLALLAKGSDATLRKAAADELSGLMAPARAGQVGGEWWTAADSLAEPARGKVRQHAASLYRTALGEATGLSRALMEKRVADVAAAQRPVDARAPGDKAAAKADPLDKATRIVFVLDATGSMMSSFDTMRHQFQTTLSSLHPPQRFDALFVNEHNPPPLAADLLPVTPDATQRAQQYVGAMAPRGSTDAAPFLKRAFDLKADLIYFMVDPTDFTKKDKQAILDMARDRSGGKIPIQVMAFEETAESRTFCQSLADLTGGTYRHVDRSDR